MNHFSNIHFFVIFKLKYVSNSDTFFSQKLPVQRQQKKHPFDMSQYCYLFCGGRIPGEKFDTPVNFIHLLPTKGRDGIFIRFLCLM